MAKTKAEKPVILITNDDSISAPGIKALVEAVKDLGKIIVVAPDKPQSGMGHAITLGQHLRLQKHILLTALKPTLVAGPRRLCKISG